MVKVKSDYHWQPPLIEAIAQMREAMVEEVVEVSVRSKRDLATLHGIINEKYVVRETTRFCEVDLPRDARMLPLGTFAGKNWVRRGGSASGVLFRKSIPRPVVLRQLLQRTRRCLDDLRRRLHALLREAAAPQQVDMALLRLRWAFNDLPLYVALWLLRLRMHSRPPDG